MVKNSPKASSAPTTGVAPADPVEAAETGRRNIVVAAFATLVGGLIGIFPFGAGLLVFLDPVLKLRSKAAAGGLR